MSDSEKDLMETKLSDDFIVEDVNIKTAKQPKAKKKGHKSGDGFFAQVKAEFKKIIWPSRQSLFRQTVAVVVSTLALGIIIYALDYVIKLGLDLIIVK